MRMILPALAACTLAATPVSAQLVGGGLVVVNVSNVANNLAQNLSVEVGDIPVNVQVPVSVAAAVCNIDVAALAKQDASGNRSCTAESTSDALSKFVKKQMRKSN